MPKLKTPDARTKWKNLPREWQDYYTSLIAAGKDAGAALLALRDSISGHPFGDKPADLLRQSIAADDARRQAVIARDARTRADAVRMALVMEQSKRLVDDPIKPAAAKAEPPKPKQKGGVIKTIIALLEGASKKKPITRGQILTALKKEFPDRNETAMASTVHSQVPGALLAEKGIKVSGDKVKGFWIEKGGR